MNNFQSKQLGFWEAMCTQSNQVDRKESNQFVLKSVEFPRLEGKTALGKTRVGFINMLCPTRNRFIKSLNQVSAARLSIAIEGAG